jgi:hypothetical protein
MKNHRQLENQSGMAAPFERAQGDRECDGRKINKTSDSDLSTAKYA